MANGRRSEELAAAQRRDPARFRQRTAETEPRKRRNVRARRREAERREGAGE